MKCPKFVWEDSFKFSLYVINKIPLERKHAKDSVCPRLRAVSLLLENPRGKEAENESRASTKPREACAAGDERKERLQWFRTTIVKPGTLVTE